MPIRITAFNQTCIKLISVMIVKACLNGFAHETDKKITLSVHSLWFTNNIHSFIPSWILENE